jgi:hypothetical protein
MCRAHNTLLGEHAYGRKTMMQRHRPAGKVPAMR